MRRNGSVLVDQNIHDMMDGPKAAIRAQANDVQPCSLDLRIGERLWQVSAIPSLAEGFNFDHFISHYAYNDLSGISSLTLTPGNIYIAELDADFFLPQSVSGFLNPKSSAGRIDLQCITLANGSSEFNLVPNGYAGKLYMIIIPQSIPIQDVRGEDFVQLRFFDGARQSLWGHQLETLHRQFPLVDGMDPTFADDGLVLHLDLKNYQPSNLVINRIGKPISVKERKTIDPAYFFREKMRDKQEHFILDGGEFALACTIEPISIPMHVCAELVAYTEGYGEFRSHYAGFFDPNFQGTIVFEIRNLSTVPMIFKHGQKIGLCRYENLRSVPKTGYGALEAKKSNYQGQRGVRLAKYFQPWPFVL